MGGVAVLVFSDLVESTALLAELGDDRMDAVRRAHFEDVRRIVEGGGGRLIKKLGDGAMASFDSALAALGAAAGIQAAVADLDLREGGIGLAARVGVAAGEPIADGEDLHGMAVVIASRLSDAAASGEVLVQELVEALVASRDGVPLEGSEEYALKGIPRPVRAARLRWRELAPPGGGRGDGSGGGDGARLPPILAAYLREPLIGRDREIGLLREATAARPGRHAVLVLGEPGIGKTRHAAAAAAEARGDGAVVALARCPPEPVVAFEPWVRAIGELALAGDEEWRARLAAAGGPELAALVPELVEHAVAVDPAAAGGVVAAEGARYRLLRGIGAALSCAAGEAPLHVVLDDAHWCDPASAQVLGHLLETPPAERLVLVVTARDRELGRRHPVSRVLADLRRTGDLTELRLEGLDPQGVAALVGARLGRAITPRLAERLRARTAGNPFFASELVRDLDELGALRDAAALEGAPVPGAVADLVEERLGRLEPAAERLLCAAAAVGPAAPVALAAAAAGLAAEEARRAVGEALSERLVDEVPAAEPTIAFPHALVREALAAETRGAERGRLHLSIARALEADPGSEPAELARHLGLAVELTGAEPAIAAHRAAAAAAAAAHDHEQAASHWQAVLGLMGEDDVVGRASTLLELGEQELLSADLVAARAAFTAAATAARASGDVQALARAALGFAGGDVGFGWEVGIDDPTSFVLLREAIDALGSADPRLTLRMTFRLAYLSVFSDDHAELRALAARAERLRAELDDPEADLLGRFTVMATEFARWPGPEPVLVYGLFEEVPELLRLAEEGEREDLLFRVVLWTAAVAYLQGRPEDCDAAIERAGEIADRLGSPRFSWEVDAYRGCRLLEHGEREAGEALIRSAGQVVRRLRPDIHVSIELTLLMFAAWVYGGQTDDMRVAFEAVNSVTPRGFNRVVAAWATAVDGDYEDARRQIRALLTDEFEPMRGPDGHLPAAIAIAVYTVFETGDREAAERLRPLIEKVRSYVIVAPPSVAFGTAGEWVMGRLLLTTDEPEEAAESFRKAIDTYDELRAPWGSAWARVDLAIALHRSGRGEEAVSMLATGEEIAQRHQVRLLLRHAAEVRAEIEGRPPETAHVAPRRTRSGRALATRGRRRALLTLTRGQDDAELERRFSSPARQRALMRGLGRSFQPTYAGGFNGIIAWELQPYAIPPPPDSPWRWALQVDADAGRARLLEPAPLDADLTIHIGLADWVRILAGAQDSLPAMVAGRCTVEGDVLLAIRLEAMFGSP